MIDWLYGFPIAWMAVVVCGATYLVAVLVDRIVLRLATGDRAKAFKAVSPGLMPPLGRAVGSTDILRQVLPAQATSP